MNRKSVIDRLKKISNECVGDTELQLAIEGFVEELQEAAADVGLEYQITLMVENRTGERVATEALIEHINAFDDHEVRADAPGDQMLGRSALAQAKRALQSALLLLGAP